MRTQSLRTKILNYLDAWYKYDPNKWIHKSVFEEEAKKKGYLAATCVRQLQQLTTEGLVDVRYTGRAGSAEYRKKEKSIEVKHNGETYYLI